LAVFLKFDIILIIIIIIYLKFSHNMTDRYLLIVKICPPGPNRVKVFCIL